MNHPLPPPGSDRFVFTDGHWRFDCASEGSFRINGGSMIDQVETNRRKKSISAYAANKWSLVAEVIKRESERFGPLSFTFYYESEQKAITVTKEQTEKLKQEWLKWGGW